MTVSSSTPPRPAPVPSDDELVSRLRTIGQHTRLLAADRIERLAAENARLRRAVHAADRGFEAALAEDWLDAIASGFPARIADLWQRHLAPARHALAEAIAGREPDAAEDRSNG